MKNLLLLITIPVLLLSGCTGSGRGPEISTHPDTSDWESLFNSGLNNSMFTEGSWHISDGVLTPSVDEVIWTLTEYENFILDLEFKNEPGTNSGVIVYCTDRDNWIPNSVEIQIADDFADIWKNADKTWQCGAIFGHLPASESMVKQPGEWNRMTISCYGKNIRVVLNGKLVTVMDMSLWTSSTTNPDGTKIPEWLSRPFAELDTRGYIGLQGKHADAAVCFRDIRIKEIE